MAKNENKGTDAKKKKREGKLFGSIARFIKEVVGELKKLTWPTKKETAANTITVLVFVVLTAAIIGVLDFVFSWGLNLLSSI